MRIDIWQGSKEQIALMIDDRSICYGELEQAIVKKTKELRLIQEHIVLLPLKRDLETVATLFACLRSQKIFVPLEETPSAIKIATIADQFKAAVYFGGTTKRFTNPTITTELPDDTLFVGFTSGTTGAPKGFVRNHESWIKSFQGLDKEQWMEAGAYVACLSPLNYTLGLFALLNALYLGKTFLLKPKNLAELFKRIDRYSNLQIFGVPTFFRDFFKKEKGTNSSYFHVILSGEYIDHTLRSDFFTFFPNAKLSDFYGSSETSFIAINQKKNPDINELGKLFTGVKVKILNPDDYGIGEITVESPLNFQGYYGKERIQQPDSFIKTGDLGRIQERLYYFGRVDERINRGGEKIIPFILETTLRKRAEIEDIKIVSAPDEILGQKVIAMISWRSQKLNVERLNAYLDKELIFKGKIDEIVDRQTFKVNPSGKRATFSLNKITEERPNAN
ncbi:AMP-binding protein [Candidatus Enterococcus lemimoniae]|uniref:AMP-dependent synthetase/ligase domain-containing protein n=1 Tax=Candidatus Enterococcus lemimoniae TaxID=1834167 RepID=A0ABZ2T573_9ENTE|nr:AMP-binding protein [Enterococcus sp. 12C11_DIV0727]OTO68738.1 hypothetical protein A5866_000936 [Enterococcus sp. 12C11_DIV0727]